MVKLNLENIVGMLAGLALSAVSCGQNTSSRDLVINQPPIPQQSDPLVFVSDRDDPEGEIYYKEIGMPNAIRLTNDNYLDQAPVLSPDKDKVAFHKAISNITWDVFVAYIDGSGVLRVTDDPSIHFRYPSWSPDGRSLVMEGAIPRVIPALGEYDLFTAEYDNSATLKDITSQLLTLHEREPVWSPKGDQICFVGTNTSFWDDLYVIAPDGTGMIKLTDNPAFEYNQRWSPDARKVAYTKWDSDVELYFTLSDGTGVETNVSNDPSSFDGNPGWLDNETIAWLKYLGGGVFGELYSKNININPGMGTNMTPAVPDTAINLRTDNNGAIILESRYDDPARGELYFIKGQVYQNETNHPFDDRLE